MLRSKYVSSPIKQEKNIKFQILNIKYGDSSELNTIEEGEYAEHYVIQLFGVLSNGSNIRVDIEDFNPYFYIEMPDNMSDAMVRVIAGNIKDKLSKKHQMAMILNECCLEEAERLYGFTNNRKFKFLKLVFKTVGALRHCSYLLSNVIKENNILSPLGIRRTQLKLYEANIEPALRFFHINKIKPADWVEVKNIEYDNPNGVTTCNLFGYSRWHNVIPYETKEISPFICMAFDIECTSKDGGFPNPRRPEDEVIMICSTFRRYGDTESFLRVIHTLKPSLPFGDCEIIYCKTEKELLMEWRNMLHNIDPDIIYGYNSNGFDFEYLVKRAKHKKNNCLREFLQMSRTGDYEESEYVEKELASSALGDNKLKYIDMKGRVIMDIMKEVQKEHKLDQYKLDFVAEHFTGQKKVDLPPKELFAKYKTGSKADIKEIGIYCLQDTELCHYIGFKLAMVVKAMKMANVCIVPLDFIFTRGQGVKIFSLISNECRNVGIKIPVIRKENVSKNTDEINKRVMAKKAAVYENEEELMDTTELEKTVIEELEEEQKQKARYEGALVIETDGGLYHKPVTILDFNSLYPSCQRGWNISHNTLVMEDQYDNIEGIKYETIEYTDYDGKLISCRYAQTEPQGIIPTVIRMLLSTRKAIKKKLKTVKDETESMILDCEQLAYKVVANSVYGQCGASVSPIYLKHIAACTTAKGREMLAIAQKVGDTGVDTISSLTIDTIPEELPILCRNDKGELEYCSVLDVEENQMILTNNGWAKIEGLYKSKFKKLKKNDLSNLILEKDTIKKYFYEYYPSNNEKNILESSAKTKLAFLEKKPKKVKLEKAMMYMFLYVSSGKDVVIKQTGDLYEVSETNGQVNEVNDKLSETNQIDKINFDSIKELYKVKLTVYSHSHNVKTVYGDTDSNFYECYFDEKEFEGLSKEKYRHKNVVMAMKVGEELSEKINKVINKPGIINFAYEKVFYPFLIITKKRYGGRKYEEDPDKYKDTFMGIALKRRNYCSFMKYLMRTLFDKIFESVVLDKEEIIKFLNGELMRLINIEVPYKELLITNTLRAVYKNPDSIPHRRVANAMERNREIVCSNDRIPYILCMKKPLYNTKGAQKKPKVADIAMHPRHAKEGLIELYEGFEETKPLEDGSIPYDPQLYIEGQIEKPIYQILYYILDNPEEFFPKYIEICKNQKIKMFGDPIIPQRKKPVRKKIVNAVLDGIVD